MLCADLRASRRCVVQEEDYDSDDETEEKVELTDEETMEGWLVNADPADWETLRASFLKELLQMPFKVTTPHTHTRTRIRTRTRTRTRATLAYARV
jgi:hypothetical protein